MKVTVPVAANEFGSATTRYMKDAKYDSEGVPWKTQLHRNLVEADLADEVLKAVEEKAIEAAPENKAMAAPEDKSETVTVEVTGSGGRGSGGGGSGTYRGGRRGAAVKGE